MNEKKLYLEAVVDVILFDALDVVTAYEVTSASNVGVSVSAPTVSPESFASGACVTVTV